MSHPSGRSGKPTAGFMLPLAIFVVALLAVLGYMFLSFSLHSKNILHVFYRDDLARLIAESAAAEFRSQFPTRSQSHAGLAALLANPTGGARVDFSAGDFPNAVQVARNLAGAGHYDFTVTASVRDVDAALLEQGGGTRKYGNEYQATLRLETRVALGPTGRRRTSRFVFEHDLKNVCVRSNFANRAGKGYFSSVMNDYLLYVRDALGEFNQLSARSLNNDNVTLSLVQPNATKLGKIFLGCGTANDPSKYVFINIDDRLQSIMPDTPAPVVADWAALKQTMPRFTQQIERACQDAVNEAQRAGKTIVLDPSLIQGVFTLDYKPIMGSQGFWAAVWARIQAVFNHFFQWATGKAANKERGIKVLGDQNADLAVCQQIQGNLRQRFWQTSHFELNLRGMTNDPDILAVIDREMQNNPNTKLDVKYYSEPDIDQMTGDGRELYELVRLIERREKTLVKSQPNEMFPFKVKPRYDERNPPADANLPRLYGRSGQEPYPSFMPYASYMLRKQIFPKSADFYNSAMFDQNGVLQLSGIVAVEQHLTIRRGLKYAGRGVIVALDGITIEGAFTRENPTRDGPCILYTVRGTITANKLEAGKIEASLIALDFRFGANPSQFAKVDFSNRPADVTGNLVADRLNLDAMARGGTRNAIAYDPDHMLGDDLYSITLGGQVRNVMFEYDRPAGPNP